MRTSKLLLASLAIVASGAGFYAFVSFFPAQSTAFAGQEKNQHYSASTSTASERSSGESNNPEVAAPNRKPAIAPVVFSPIERTAIDFAPQLASRDRRAVKTESLEMSPPRAPLSADNERSVLHPIEQRATTLPEQFSTARILAASNTPPQQIKPQQPRVGEPTPSAKLQPPKSGTTPVGATSPEPKPSEFNAAPRKPAGAVASPAPVNLPSPENPPSVENPAPRLPKFFNEEAELYRTQYGEEAYAVLMREAALSPEPSAPAR